MMKDGKHRLAYGFLLNKVFDYFDGEYAPGKDVFVNQMFTLSILEENECIPRWSRVKCNSVVADLIEVYTS